MSQDLQVVGGMRSTLNILWNYQMEQNIYSGFFLFVFILDFNCAHSSSGSYLLGSCSTLRFDCVVQRLFFRYGFLCIKVSDLSVVGHAYFLFLFFPIPLLPRYRVSGDRTKRVFFVIPNYVRGDGFF